MEFFCKTTQQLRAANYFRKKLRKINQAFLPVCTIVFRQSYALGKSLENLKKQVDIAKAEFMDYFQFYKVIFWFNCLP